LCWEEGKFFFLGWLFAVGESWDWKEEEQSWQSGHILTFTDGFTDRIILSMILSAILTVNRHVTVRKFRFESLDDSVDMLNGEVVTSPYRSAVLDPSVIPSVKSPAKMSTSANCLFFNSAYSVCHSVGKYRPNVSVGIYRWNDGWKKLCR
jgi:hypothetical protein